MTLVTMQNDGIMDAGTALCLHCGLCCQGVFHTMVKIRNDEDKRLALQMGASLMDHEEKLWFRLPCPAFDGKCTIYPNRPSTCELHKCNLLRSVQSGDTGLEKAFSVSDEIKKLIEDLDIAFLKMEKHTTTKEISLRFHRLFSSQPEMLKDPIFKKENGQFLANYTAYGILKKKYFYDN